MNTHRCCRCWLCFMLGAAIGIAGFIAVLVALANSPMYDEPPYRLRGDSGTYEPSEPVPSKPLQQFRCADGRKGCQWVAIPEPGTMALVGMGLVILWRGMR